MTFDFRRSVSLWLVYALGCCALAHHGRAIAQEASSATRPSETQSPRLRMTLNDAWRFVPEDRQEGQDEKCEDSAWEIVDVPHTWNTVDPFDDPPGYRRGGSWYRKRLDLGDSFKGKQLFLYFEGVLQ